MLKEHFKQNDEWRENEICKKKMFKNDQKWSIFENAALFGLLLETSFGFSDRECRVVLLFSKARLHEEDTKDVPLKKLLRLDRKSVV